MSARGGDGALRLLQLTDSHLFADPASELAGRAPQAGFARVREAIAAREPALDGILVTGDLSHDGSEAAYERLRQALEPLAPRVLVIPGNHDDPARMRQLFHAGPVQWVTSEVLGDWHLVLLDTACADTAAGRLGSEQLAALDELLAAHPDRPTLIALHHQPLAVGTPWIDGIGLMDGDALIDCLARHDQVRALLCGHVHQAFAGVAGGVPLLAAPATSMQFQPGSQDFTIDDQAPGYRWLELGSDGALATGVERIG
jgi:Icc protein